MGVHWKIQFLGGNCLKEEGLGQFADLRNGEGLGKNKGERVFLREVDTLWIRWEDGGF